LIRAWVDASHLSEGAYGVSGYAIFLDNNLISWRSRKQRTVALSSMESEVNALADVIKEIIWIKELLIEIGVKEIKVSIHEDNQAAIAASKNAIINDRTRHILAKTTFIRETIKDHHMKLTFEPTKSQLADGFTKAKGPGEFHTFKLKLGLKEPITGKGECRNSQSAHNVAQPVAQVVAHRQEGRAPSGWQKSPPILTI
jgi:hypothetical protein